jgi:hypothetical protein
MRVSLPTPWGTLHVRARVAMSPAMWRFMVASWHRPPTGVRTKGVSERMAIPQQRSKSSRSLVLDNRAEAFEAPNVRSQARPGCPPSLP